MAGRSDTLGAIVVRIHAAARRETTLSTGKKYDSEKPDITGLLSHHESLMGVLADVGAVLAYGREKYGDDDNWLLVDDAERRYTAAAIRHIAAHLRGEELDSESARNHLSHAIVSLMFILAIKGRKR